MKKKSSRFFCLVLSVLMLLSVLPMTALAADGEQKEEKQLVHTVVGDSIAAAYGLPTYEERSLAVNGWKGGVADGTIIDGSYAQIIDDALNAEGRSHARCGWRTAELLTALGQPAACGDAEVTAFMQESMSMGAVSVMASEQNGTATANSMAQDLREADFITMNFGGNDIFTYAICCSLWKNAEKLAEMKIPDFSQAKCLNELVRDFVLLLEFTEDVTGLLADFANSCEEGLELYKTNLPRALEAITALNDEAQLFVLSPDDPMRFTVTLSDGTPVDLYTIVSAVMSYVDIYAAEACSKYTNVTYVDVTGASYYGIQNADMSTMFADEESAMEAVRYVHPDEDGHRYIAGKLIPVIRQAMTRPGAVEVTLNAKNQPVVNWDKVDGASSYRVYRSTQPDSGYTLLDKTALTRYVDTKAGSAKGYYYRVVAVMDLLGNNCSRHSEAAYISLRAPGVPTVKITTDAASGKPVLTWNAVDEAATYSVKRSVDGGKTYSDYLVVSENRVVDTTAQAGQTCYYRVKAVGANGMASDLSDAHYITCDCAKPVVTISTNAATGKPVLKWNAVDGADKYYIYRATSKGGTYQYYYSTTALSFTNTSAAAGDTYYYQVKAVSNKTSAANSALSDAHYTTCDCARPVVSISTNAFGKPVLKWNAVAGADKYYVYRSTNGGKTYSYYYSTTATSFTNTSATAGSTYYYQVKAVSNKTSSANSALSAAKSIKAK